MRIALMIAVSFNLIAAVVIWLFCHRSGCFRERCRWAHDLAAANARIKMLETEYAECATNANATAEAYESLCAHNRTTIQDQRTEIQQLKEEATRLKKEKDSIDIELLFYKTEGKAAGERILKLEAKLKNSNEVSVIFLKAETDQVKRLQSRIMSLTAKIGAMKRSYESTIRRMQEKGAEVGMKLVQPDKYYAYIANTLDLTRGNLARGIAYSFEHIPSAKPIVIPGYEWMDLCIFKRRDGKWSITEGKTGAWLALEPTRIKAIKAAIKELMPHSKRKIQSKLNKRLEKYELSPRWSRK